MPRSMRTSFPASPRSWGRGIMSAARRLAAFVACCVYVATRSGALTVLQQSPIAPGDLALGRRVDANSTCGVLFAEPYCAAGNVCGLCDAADPQRAHNATSLNDGDEATWWQSRGGEPAVTLELRLEQLAYFAAFSVTYKSPRPLAAVLERSVDFGQVYTPYQYYARNCSEYYGLEDTEGATSDPGQASCTSVYSDGQAGTMYYNVSATSSGPQAWFYMTNLRLRMLQFDSSLSHGPLGDRFYAAYEVVVVGGCHCHGHATSCEHSNQSQKPADVVPLLCQCLNNTTGANCEQCLPGYYRDDPTNLEGPCVACQCSTEGSQRSQCDPSTRQCPCKDGYSGLRCDQCTSGYFRSPTLLCLPCDCDPDGTLSCDGGTGVCLCHLGVMGQRCDRCPAGYLGPDRNILGRCLNCFCNGYSSSCTRGLGWVQSEVVNTFASDVELAGWKSIGGVVSNGTRNYLEVVATKDVKSVSLEFPRSYCGDKRTAYGQLVELDVSLPDADVGKTYSVSMEIVGQVGRYSVVQLNTSLVLTNGSLQTVKVPLLPTTFSIFERVGYLKASEKDLREALASVLSITLTYPASVSTFRLVRTRLPYASRNPLLQTPMGGEVRYVENCTSSCPRGRGGERCGGCTEGYTVDPAYGGEFSRCVPCYCSFRSKRCDPVSAVCFDCLNNTEGDRCQYCSRGYTREQWYKQCDQCDAGYWKEKGVCTACGCHANGSLSNLCSSTGTCSCRGGVVGPKCDQCDTNTTGLFPMCRPCGECAARQQAKIDPLQREVDFLLGVANTSDVFKYRGLDWDVLSQLWKLLTVVEKLLADNDLELDMLDLMAQMIHTRLTNRTTEVSLLYGQGTELQSTLRRLESTSLYVLEQTSLLKQRLDDLRIGLGTLSNRSSSFLAAAVDHTPLLRVFADALALSNLSQQLIAANVSAQLQASIQSLLLASMDQSQFRGVAQHLLARLQNVSLELDDVERFLRRASLELCGGGGGGGGGGANTTTVASCLLCGSAAPCGESLYGVSLGALGYSREAWLIALATVRRLGYQLQGLRNISLALGRVNESSLMTLDTLVQTEGAIGRLLYRIQTLMRALSDEVGHSRENVSAIVGLEKATLGEKLPIDLNGFRQILLRINSTVSDILAINISLANQSVLLGAANDALAASISARNLATRVVNISAVVQLQLVRIRASLDSAHQIIANVSQVSSAVTFENDQTKVTQRGVEVVLGRTALTIANLSLLVADLKAKFAQNGYHLGLVSNTTLSTQHLSSQLLTQTIPAVQNVADLAQNEATRVLKQSEIDLTFARTLRSRADSLAITTQDQLLILESYQLTKGRLLQRQQEILDDTKRLANQIGMLSNQLRKLVTKNTACLDTNSLV